MHTSRQLYKLKDQIRTGSIKLIWPKLRELCKETPEFRSSENSLFVLEARFSQFQSDVQNGILSSEQKKIDQAQIIKSTLDFLSQLQSISPDREAWAPEEERLRRALADKHRAMGFDPILEETELIRMIRLLGLTEEMGLIHLVNCDRVRQTELFWQQFDDKDEHDFQFYFLPSCSRQQADSFSERMIYELIDQELDEDWQAISIEQTVSTDRLIIQALPLGRNLRISKKKLRKYFSQRFEMDVVDFSSFFLSGSAPSRFEAVATVFQIDEQDWNLKLLEEYLQWLIQEFDASSITSRTRFYFFFVVHMPFANIRPTDKGEKILKQIEGIVQKNENCTLIPPLPPVRQEDIFSWLRKLGSRNQEQMDRILKVLVNSLTNDKSKQQFEEQKTLDMTHVEPFQQLVYLIQQQYQAHAEYHL